MWDRDRLYKACGRWWEDTKGSIAVGGSVMTVALLVIGFLQAKALIERYPVITWGSVSEALGAVGTVLAVAVALWQSAVIRGQAKVEAKEAAERFQGEINSANARTVQEVEAAEIRSQRELNAAAERHAAELDNQREIARKQRVHLQEQEFKLALIRVSRAANAYTQELATLIAETSHILALDTRQKRDDALKPVSKRLGSLIVDLSMEVTGAGFFTNNEKLRVALDDITEAAMKGPYAEINFRNQVVRQEHPNEAPLFMVMDELPRVIGNARTLAAELLVTGWEQ